MSAKLAPARMAVEEFLDWADAREDDGRYELDDGRVVAMAPERIVQRAPPGSPGPAGRRGASPAAARCRGVMTRPIALLALAAASCVAIPAFAACTVPAPPPDPASRPAKPTAPVKGPCVDKQPGTPGCLGWEAYKFNDEVKAYNAQIPAFKAAAEAYVAKLNAYVAAAAAYAKCEVDQLR